MRSLVNHKFWIVLLLAGMAAGLSASLATAQEYEGKFTLPFTAQWGQATLAPGDYTLKFNNASQPKIAKVYGENTTAIVVANAGMRAEQVAGPSALIAVRRNGKYQVRFLRLAEAGLVFEYVLPGGERQLIGRNQDPMIIRRVPVTMAGK